MARKIGKAENGARKAGPTVHSPESTVHSPPFRVHQPAPPACQVGAGRRLRQAGGPQSRRPGRDIAGSPATAGLPGGSPVGPAATAGPRGLASTTAKHLRAPAAATARLPVQGQAQAGTKPTKPLRLLLLDDDPKTQAEVRALVEAQAGKWVLDIFTAPSGLAKALRIQPLAPPPDVVLMEIGAHGYSGVEHIRELKALWPTVPIVVFTSRSDTDAMLQAIMAGAQGYLLKPLAPDDLLRATQGAGEGQRVLCQEAQSAMMDCLHRARERISALGLTQREQQVGMALVQHFSDKDIAVNLGIETGTVHAHVASLFEKLGVHKREEAIKKLLDVH